MDRKEVLKSWRLDENVVRLVNDLSKSLGIKKGEVVEKAIIQYADKINQDELLEEMKSELEEIKNDIKVIRLYHILDTLKRSDYSNNKDVPKLDIRFDKDGKYGKKGEYVIRKGDMEILADYIRHTTNFYDKTIQSLANEDKVIK